jgi:hypothetical protein
MENTVFGVIEPAHSRGRRANPHLAELHALFTAACRFGLTRAERDEWGTRFGQGIAALEAQLAAQEARLSERAAA